MATIRPNALPVASLVSGSDAIIIDNGAVVAQATPAQLVDAAIPLASQAEAEAGTDNAKRVTPLRVKQALDALALNRADLLSTATGKGDVLVGSDDGASGSLWTTIKGFIAYLRGAHGASIVQMQPTGATTPVDLETFLSLQHKTLGQFGAVGDGVTDDTVAIQAAFAWASAAQGRALFIAAKSFVYSSDITILGSQVFIYGLGVKSRFMAKSGAKFIIGHADVSATTGSPPYIVKSAVGKVTDIWLSNFAIKPVDQHPDECLLLDNCDNVHLKNLNIGPFGSNGTVATNGIKLHWCQWTYIDDCQINVNNYAIHVLMDYNQFMNEDHLHIKNCNLDVDKKAVAGANVGGIVFEVGDGRGLTGMGEFSVYDTHFYSTSGGTVQAATRSGIAVKSNSSIATKAINCGIVMGCMFEGTQYPLDLSTMKAGAGSDSSILSFEGTYFLQSATVFLGNSLSLGGVASTGNRFLQVDHIATLIRVRFGPNNTCSVTGGGTNAFTDGVTKHTFFEKNENSAALSGLGNPYGTLIQSGSVSVASTDTSAVITLALAAAPTKFRAWNQSGAAWLTPYAFGTISSTAMTIYFNAPGATRTLYWEATAAYT